MKRSELTPGMKVEIKRGTTHTWFTTGVIVMGTEDYVESYRWRDGILFEPADGGQRRDERAFRGGTRGARGIPVAVPGVDGWEPKVVPLRTLVPAGTKAAEDAVRDEEIRRADARYAQTKARENALAARLGSPVSIHRGSARTGVGDLERLLDERDRLRSAVEAAIEFNRDHIDPVSLDDILRSGLTPLDSE